MKDTNIERKLIQSSYRENEKDLITKEDIICYFYDTVDNDKYKLNIINNSKKDIISFNIDTNTYFFNLSKFSLLCHFLYNDKNNTNDSSFAFQYNVSILEAINKIISEIELKNDISNGSLLLTDPTLHVLLVNETISEIANPANEKQISDFYSFNKSKQKTLDMVKEASVKPIEEQKYRATIDSYFINILNNNMYCPYKDMKYVKTNLRRAMGKKNLFILDEVFGENAKNRYMYALNSMDFIFTKKEPIYNENGEIDHYIERDTQSLLDKLLFGKCFTEEELYEIADLYNPVNSITDNLTEIYSYKKQKSLRK